MLGVVYIILSVLSIFGNNPLLVYLSNRIYREEDTREDLLKESELSKSLKDLVLDLNKDTMTFLPKRFHFSYWSYRRQKVFDVKS